MTIAEVKRALLRVEDELSAAVGHSNSIGLLEDENVQELRYQADFQGHAMKAMLSAVRGLVEIIEGYVSEDAPDGSF